jgi:hypothetical protein
MHQDPKGEGGAELRVEHILAGLDQISKLCAQLHKAVSGLDPKTVIGRAVDGHQGPPGVELVGHCEPAPPEGERS